MTILKLLGILYLTFGALYALWVILNRINPWKSFFINTLLGPIVLLYNYIKFSVLKKGLPR